MDVSAGLGKLALEQGLWAALFVSLLLWTLKQNAQREQRYLEIIQTLGEEIKNRLDLLESGLTGFQGKKR